VTTPDGHLPSVKVTVFTPGGSDNFYQATEELLGTGTGANSIISGPLTAPNTGDATVPGQTTYHHGGFPYPDTYDNEFDGQNRWVDVEVTPASSSPPSATPAESAAGSRAFLNFFP
jgi:hypothetical protein